MAKARGGDGRVIDPTDNYDPALDGSVDAATLRKFVERIERLETEKREIADDIKEVYAEAKAAGFDPKGVRFVIAERRKDADDVDEFNIVCDRYRAALKGKPTT